MTKCLNSDCPNIMPSKRYIAYDECSKEPVIDKYGRCQTFMVEQATGQVKDIRASERRLIVKEY